VSLLRECNRSFPFLPTTFLPSFLASRVLFPSVTSATLLMRCVYGLRDDDLGHPLHEVLVREEFRQFLTHRSDPGFAFDPAWLALFCSMLWSVLFPCRQRVANKAMM
jgi:hypothetical protein